MSYPSEAQPCVTPLQVKALWPERAGSPQVRYQRPQGSTGVLYVPWIFSPQKSNSNQARRSQGTTETGERLLKTQRIICVPTTPVAENCNDLPFCLSAEAVLFVCHIFIAFCIHLRHHAYLKPSTAEQALVDD